MVQVVVQASTAKSRSFQCCDEILKKYLQKPEEYTRFIYNSLDKCSWITRSIITLMNKCIWWLLNLWFADWWLKLISLITLYVHFHAVFSSPLKIPSPTCMWYSNPQFWWKNISLLSYLHFNSKCQSMESYTCSDQSKYHYVQWQKANSSCCFLFTACLVHPCPWRWRQYVPSKCQRTSTALHAITPQKIVHFIINTVRTSNPVSLSTV
jgi:hypothetical protein